MAHGALLYGFTWSLHKNRLHVVSRRKEEKRVLRMGLRLVPQAFVLPSFILPTAARCKIAIRARARAVDRRQHSRALFPCEKTNPEKEPEKNAEKRRSVERASAEHARRVARLYRHQCEYRHQRNCTRWTTSVPKRWQEEERRWYLVMEVEAVVSKCYE